VVEVSNLHHTEAFLSHRKSFAWRQALADLGASGKLTGAYRPQTNCEDLEALFRSV
jgi:hypothetical protein